MGSPTTSDEQLVSTNGHGPRVDPFAAAVGVANDPRGTAQPTGEHDRPPEPPRPRGLLTLLRHQNLRQRLTLHSLLIMAVTLGAAAIVALWSTGALVAEAEQRDLQRVSDALESDLDTSALRAATLATGLATTPAIAEAFAQRDRDALAALVIPSFERLQADFGVAQVHFHEPPAVSFLRAHEPEEFGDDLSGFRETVVVANADRTVITGLEGGRFGLGLRAVVPIDWDGAHAGTVEVGTSLGDSFFTRFAAVNEVDVALYLADAGEGAGGPTFTTYASSIGDVPAIGNAELVEVLRGEVRHASFDHAGASMTARYAPVYDFAGTAIGVSMVAVPNDDLRAILTRERLGFLALAVALLMVGGVTASLFARELSRPITEIQRVLGRARDGDLSTRAAVDRGDEIGVMARDVNETFDRLGLLMRDVAVNAETLAAAADEMSAVGQQLEANASETADRAVIATDAAKAVSDNVGSIAGASHQMSAAVEEIARNANDATSVANRGVVVTDETVAAMEKLGESSAEIDAVVSLISEIAGQTHLLALNANIEAARAGDAGRAFAVVANEIGTLARRTATESETISDRIRGIRADTETSVGAMSAVSETMREISELQTSIASAVEEQAATTAEIGRSVSDAAEATGEIAHAVESVSEGTGETRQAAGDTASAARELHDLAGRLRDSIAYYAGS